MSKQVKIETASTSAHLKGILSLQGKNLKQVVSSEEANQEGFVTLKHDLSLLSRMNDLKPHIIALDNEEVVGYALTMVRQLKKEIPILKPMFQLLETLEYNGKLLKDSEYYVMGQVCISKSHRGQGIFKGMYDKHKEVFSSDFEYCITEVSESNARSLRAHEKVGFKTIHTYLDATDHWHIILLELR